MGTGNKIKVIVFTIFFFVVTNLQATHIVGGALTYVYNGGNSYTITCKLYRDCKPGTFAMPNSLTVTVRGLNGEVFNPTRDIAIPRIKTTPVPSSLDSCAIRPNPEPCVEEGFFQITTNLPPSQGGYHLYINTQARNLSLTNINSSGNNIGETFYCFIPPPTTLWLEDFTLANGTTVDNGATAWSITNGSTAPSSASVNGNTFQVVGASKASVWWVSQTINISAYPGGVQLGMDLSETGNLSSNDSIKTYYSVNGGPLIPFTFNGSISGDFTAAASFTNGVIGNTVKIYVKVVYATSANNSRVYKIDNVGVYHLQTPNSDPTFNLFPPLYLCAGQRFEFDHSATDLDGDSLAYSFYTPFNGYNATPSIVSPTYVNNYANFTPVVFLPSYGTNNPLGGNVLTINSQTGLLSGIPTTLGQFVVGIKVTEYRNGVFVSETYRDFQFNVINCPPTRKALLTNFKTCVGTKVKFTTASDTSQTTTWWDFGDPATASDTSIKHSPTYTYPGVGTYIVTLITSKGTVCEDSAKAPVYVGWTKAYFKKTTDQCIGYPIYFTDSSTFSANASAATYTWNFGDASSSNQANPSHIYNSPGTYTVTMTVNSSIGCSDTYATTVTVGPAPTVNAGADITVCSSSPAVTLNGSVTNATGGVWASSGTGTFSSTTNLTGVTYTPSATDIAAGIVKITLTSVSSSVCKITDTLIVKITASPTNANAGTNQIVCGVNSTILNANAPSVGTGVWSTASGVSILNPNSPTTQVTGLLLATTYNFTWTITNGNNCTSKSVVKVQVDDLPTTAQAGADLSLCDITNTTLNANTPTVGTGTWSIVNGTATITQLNNPNTSITNLVKGDTVTLRWTIAQGVCKNYDDITVIVNKIPVVNAGQQQDVCNQNPSVSLNGTVTVATGGIWSGGSGSYIPNNQTLVATYYPSSSEINFGSVTLTLNSTGNGACPSVSSTVKINLKPFNGTVSVTSTPAACYGEQNGSISANISNGSGGYTYTWNSVPPQYTSTATNLPVGNYMVTVKDNLNCSSTANGNVIEPSPLSATVTANAVLCYGGSTGSANVNASGGNGNYTYSWTPVSGNTQTITNLSIGTYSVIVTDNKGCSTTKNITITQPSDLQVAGTSTNILCNGGNNGKINITPTGGVLPYTYSWSTANGIGVSANSLTAGSYNVIITDANGCQKTYNNTITEPTILAATLQTNHLTCFQNNSGYATVNVTGGTNPYTYSWSPSISSTTNTANNLPSGSYFISVKDANNCSWNQSFTITQPSDISAAIGAVKQVSCFNGNDASITVSAIGGTGAYSYTWSPNVSTASTAANLTAGNYQITVSDQNGCSKQINQAITQPSDLQISETHTNPACYGYNNGVIQTAVSGGTIPYEYSWSVSGVGNQADYNGLPVGVYTIVSTDFNGCSKSVSVTLTQPTKINLITNSSTSTCGFANGSGNVSASGGSGIYTYTWAGQNQYAATLSNVAAGFYPVYVYDNTGCFDSTYLQISDVAGPTININSVTNVSCYGGNDGTATVNVTAGTPPYTYNWSTNPNQNSATATNLTQGMYAVSVTDSNGCSTIAVTAPPIAQPDSVSFDADVQDNLCFGNSSGAITITPTGGTAPYTVTWVNPNTVNSSINNLAPGNYTFTIKDAHNCTLTKTLTVTQAALLQSNVNGITDASCLNKLDGSAQVTASGGTQPYTYSWSSNSVASAINNNLGAGVHWVYIKDTYGCRDSVSFTVNQPSDSIHAILTLSDAHCYNQNSGSAIAIASGGNGSYTYTWLPVNTQGSSVNNLLAGNYSLIVNDVKGCNQIFNFSIQQPNPLNANINVQSSTCGFSNGKITANAMGGTIPYQYTWQPSNLHTNSITQLASGTYYLTVTDSLGCERKDTISLQNIASPQIIHDTTISVTCFGYNNGSAQIYAQAVAPPLTYSWSPQISTDSIAQNLIAGNYWAFAKDVNGCKDSVLLIVTQPNLLRIDTIPTTDVLCKDSNNGTAMAMVSGGTPTYLYSWSFTNQNTALVNNIPPGQHSVLVSDANHCTTQTSFFINEPQKLIVAPSSIVSATCSGYTDGSISLNVNGGNYPYTYHWSNDPNLNAPFATGLQAGSYFVTVADSKGCYDTLQLVVEEPSSVVVVIANDPTICLGQTATLTATATGGNGAPYNYEWQPIPGNGNTLTVTPTQTENHYVTATDKKGCISNADVATVTVYSLFAGDIDILLKNPICKGTSTTIQAASNGTNTGPLTYTWNQGLGYGAGPFTISPPAPTVYQVTVATTCGTQVIVRDTLKFVPPPVPGFKSDTVKGCYPLKVLFTDTTKQNPNDPVINWIWNFGNGYSTTGQNATYTYNTPGTYYATLNVQTMEGCNVVSSPTKFKIVVYPHPSAAFTPNPPFVYIPLGVVNFNNQSLNASAYTWDFGDGITSNTNSPKYTYNDVGTYTVTLIAIDKNGCKDTTYEKVIVSGDFVMPTAFTPNPDGPNGGMFDPAALDNDVFNAYTKGVKEYKMHIFDRWGELIFESTDPKIGWDGYYREKLCQAGVYIWKVYIKFIDDRELHKVGDVTLIR